MRREIPWTPWAPNLRFWVETPKALSGWKRPGPGPVAAHGGAASTPAQGPSWALLPCPALLRVSAPPGWVSALGGTELGGQGEVGRGARGWRGRCQPTNVCRLIADTSQPPEKEGRWQELSTCPWQHFQFLPGDFLIIPPDSALHRGWMEEWEGDRFSVKEGLRAHNLLEGFSPGDLV